MSKEEAKREIGKLVERLKSLSPSDFRRYNEENTKKDFILPMFRALGWNTDDFREVAAEDRVSRGHVDYAFRLDSRIPFFLEAKPLKADLDNPDYARQAIKYAWNRGVSWAVLTDFENLKVFNAEWEERDLRRNIFLDLSYQDYLKEFDLVWLLSKPAMQQRLLDQEAENVGKKIKKRPVGEQLFEDLVKWRWELRRHLEPYNRKYTAAQIDEAVQRILDRLIFIRAAEDRGIEQERLLLSLVRQWQGEGRKGDLLKMLNDLFRDFDEGYDSALFERHFSEELDCEPKPFEDTITGLYRTPDGINEYDFNAIGADVLGGIYEQYLGYAQGLAVEEVSAKRERRKKQGIYYTPQFVVKYIVQNTVGRLLEERSHHEIRKLRILDPACGSGSFLIEAFDVLDQYRKGRRRTDELQDYSRRLEILTENIYGVDLDPQAVEIAQLNLLLKTLNRRERLPNLNPNIRRGNSLISGTRGELTQYFGAKWEARRPFNWDEEFPKAMKEGGFDVVIGNPPYVRIQTLDKAEVGYYNEHYHAATGNYDIYTLFIERGLGLLKPGGFFGMILPNKFMQAAYGEGLRTLLFENKAVSRIVDFGDAQIFGAGTTYTCLLFLKKTSNAKLIYIPANDILKDDAQGPNLPAFESQAVMVNPESLGTKPWVFTTDAEGNLLTRLMSENSSLADVTDRIFQGVKTGADRVYILGIIRRKGDKLVVHSKATGKTHEIEAEILHPLIKGGQMRRYNIQRPELAILFPYKGGDLISANELKARYPLAMEYLKANKGRLKEREGGELVVPSWFSFSRNQAIDVVHRPKIVTPDVAAEASYCYDEKGDYYFSGGAAGGYGIFVKREYDPKFVLGLLNSRLVDWCLHKVSAHFQGGYFSYEARFIRQLPIRRIDFGNPQDVKLHNRMVELVERMLELHKRLRDAVGEERKDLERKIERTDRQIDELAYELYGITEEDRKVIEEQR